MGILFLIGLSATYPLDLKKQPRWTTQLGSWIMHRANEYFGMKLYLQDEAALRRCGPAIFVFEAHDIMPIGIVALSDYLGLVPGHRVIGNIDDRY